MSGDSHDPEEPAEDADLVDQQDDEPLVDPDEEAERLPEEQPPPEPFTHL